ERRDVGKVPIERSRGDARRTSDLTQAEAAEALLLQQLKRGVEQCLAGPLLSHLSDAGGDLDSAGLACPGPGRGAGLQLGFVLDAGLDPDPGLDPDLKRGPKRPDPDVGGRRAWLFALRTAHVAQLTRLTTVLPLSTGYPGFQ